jgi:hypothetical protein
MLASVKAADLWLLKASESVRAEQVALYRRIEAALRSRGA